MAYISDEITDEPEAAPPATIAERIELGRSTQSLKNGAIVPFPDGVCGKKVLSALRGKERKTYERLYAARFRATVYEYRSSEGETIQAVIRFDHSSEPKEIRPLRYCGCKAGQGHIFWFTAIDAQRPLYGLDRLAARPDAPVLVVEGEKTADAAAALFPNYVVITWMSGANSVHRAEMIALEGRKVTLWPDNDPPGRTAMRKSLRSPSGQKLSQSRWWKCPMNLVRSGIWPTKFLRGLRPPFRWLI